MKKNLNKENLKRYVLDTSSILTLRDDDPGSNQIEKLLSKALQNEIIVYASFISFIEVFTTIWEYEGEESAKVTYAEMKTLPIQMVNMNETILIKASTFKSRYGFSLSDSLIFATAIEKGAILVHKNPAFEKISNLIETITLPYLDIFKIKESSIYRKE